MPNTYSISNLLEIKDLIVDDFISSSTVFIYTFILNKGMFLVRFVIQLPIRCTTTVHLLLKTLQFKVNFYFCTIKREDIIAITVIIISMSLLTYYPNIAV